jgi:hypothetical protein
MPYCRKCGKEVGEDAKYCPACGSAVDTSKVRYSKPRRGSTAGKVIAVIFGGLLILVSFGVLAGGAALIWAQGALTDPQGFMISKPVRLQTDSYALALQNLDIHMEPSVMRGIWNPTPADILTIKLTASSNDPSKDVFIGVARSVDAADYLNGISYEEIRNLSWNYNPWDGEMPTVTYVPHSGSPPTRPPSTVAFWVASAHGAGEQTIEWVPSTGTYWIIAMNADVLADVDIDVRLGAKIPILSGIGDGLIVAGVIGLVASGLIIYYGAVRRW